MEKDNFFFEVFIRLSYSMFTCLVLILIFNERYNVLLALLGTSSFIQFIFYYYSKKYRTEIVIFYTSLVFFIFIIPFTIYLPIIAIITIISVKVLYDRSEMERKKYVSYTILCLITIGFSMYYTVRQSYLEAGRVSPEEKLVNFSCPLYTHNWKENNDEDQMAVTYGMYAEPYTFQKNQFTGVFTYVIRTDYGLVDSGDDPDEQINFSITFEPYQPETMKWKVRTCAFLISLNDDLEAFLDGQDEIADNKDVDLSIPFWYSLVRSTTDSNLLDPYSWISTYEIDDYLPEFRSEFQSDVFVPFEHGEQSHTLHYSMPDNNLTIGKYLMVFYMSYDRDYLANKDLYFKDTKVKEAKKRINLPVNLEQMYSLKIKSESINETRGNGYSYLLQDLSTDMATPGFLNDIYTEELILMLSVFYLTFFIVVLVSMLMQKDQLIISTFLMIMALLTLITFQRIEHAYDNPPGWLRLWGKGENYIWAGVTAIKMGIVIYVTSILLGGVMTFLNTGIKSFKVMDI